MSNSERTAANAESEFSARIEKLEQLLAERNTQLDTATRELDAFTYAISHDLRAPLRSIAGFSQMLREAALTSLDTQAQHYLQRIEEAAQQMAKLIEALLALSRIGRTELAARELDLSEIFATAIAVVSPRYPEQRVAIDIQKNLRGWGDSRLVRILAEQLLDNAWKFTQRIPDPRVVVCSEDSARGPAIVVRDNGVGFQMMYESKLFTPCQRLHSEPLYAAGTGMGLATAQRIVAKHGGTIWAVSTPGQGASFFFTLPHPH